MKQLVLDLQLPALPSFEDFIRGENAELLYQLGCWSLGEGDVRFLYFWGERGSGKSHLLAAARAMLPAGTQIFFTDAAHDALPASLPKEAALIVDNVDALSRDEQIRLFDHFNTLKDGGGLLLAAGPKPPMLLLLRPDLTTRLGWGLVYQLKPLSDTDKAAALKRRAYALGFELGDDLADYLLRHASRDLPTLYQHLDAANDLSLTEKRPVTVSLLREVLRGDWTE
ncbi:DnaA regulatory inactivator Hda [Iodobacter fluviatilis]|uniref:DnaA-homolog protein hda n=1 Tax=Iodobacter fluviatilis TaxID=537 RepID=A0A377SUJ1_9NEIS|nr:DnaA regulatory inactivator Hda [Iodobacter fluviatilis]TCU85584.1 regulatory inactivation of DnaA Hda protein [Iodobacter fluviatilis]STR44968.1 DnaA-homolog protein hda [Iodobacter fluviatilis]